MEEEAVPSTEPSSSSDQSGTPSKKKLNLKRKKKDSDPASQPPLKKARCVKRS